MQHVRRDKSTFRRDVRGPRTVNAKGDDNFDWMPLHCPSWPGHLKVVQLLFQHEAPLKAQIRDNDPTLCLALERGGLEVVRLLLDHGADVHSHIRRERDRTPFQVATVKRHHDVDSSCWNMGPKENE